MEHETAGDPITGLKWTKKTTEKIADEFRRIGIQICANTVGDLLKDMNYSLRINHKKIESTGKTDKKSRTERDLQFRYIKQNRTEYMKQASPSLSIDCKKKESVGNFRNSGETWCKQAKAVNVYDFRSLAIGVGIPYGIYDLLLNFGFVVVGSSYDTPKFAVNSIEKWYQHYGLIQYPAKDKLLIIADGGGSNSSRSTMWKYSLQNIICNRYGLTVTVCHYPPGTSKYNPIEHRLFSQISNNWAGTPLVSYETMLNFIKTTKTKTGLRTDAVLDKAIYEKGKTVSKNVMNSLAIEYHDILPKWNYTIKPQ